MLTSADDSDYSGTGDIDVMVDVPPGGQVIILQKVLEMDYAGVEDWPTHKQEIESYVLGR